MTDSSEPITETSVRERLAGFIATEWDDEINPVVGAQWPQREGDDGYRGDGGYVAIQPPDVLARCREQSGRLLAFIDALNRRSVTSQASEGAVVAWRIRERPGFPWQFVDYDPARMPNVRGWEHEPLYASPSKRVERLETKIEALIVAATDARNWLGKSLTAKRVDDAISELRQALQGGRS